jgi:hypothetical protein
MGIFVELIEKAAWAEMKNSWMLFERGKSSSIFVQA